MTPLPLSLPSGGGASQGDPKLCTPRTLAPAGLGGQGEMEQQMSACVQVSGDFRGGNAPTGSNAAHNPLTNKMNENLFSFSLPLR